MSKMDVIGECLFDALLSADQKLTQRLKDEMTAYATTYHRSMHNLLKIPGFKKLWDAMDEGASFGSEI